MCLPEYKLCIRYHIFAVYAKRPMNTAYIPAITNNFQLYNNERNKENIDFINNKKL